VRKKICGEGEKARAGVWKATQGLDTSKNLSVREGGGDEKNHGRGTGKEGRNDRGKPE